MYNIDMMKIEIKLLNSIQIRKLFGISRQRFWQIKTRKGFPEPLYSENGIELWAEKDILSFNDERNATRRPKTAI